ncbi:hypothetical protein, partial [Lysinibacillus sp. NPDC059133]|uniref:hypothetical protein n=1 Tax=Lysinibacillus sp. NPDC059133 TaxID=3346737 RepID=UPI0036A702B9
RQQQLFYLCESVATATTNVFCSESKAAATKRPAGTEINPSLCRRVILFIYVIGFQQTKRMPKLVQHPYLF